MRKYSAGGIISWIFLVLGILSSAVGADDIEDSYIRGKTLIETGDLEEALPYLEQVEQRAPGYKSVRSYLFMTYKFVGIEFYVHNRLDEAITIWQKALDIDPANTEIADYIERSRNELRVMNKLQQESSHGPPPSMPPESSSDDAPPPPQPDTGGDRKPASQIAVSPIQDRKTLAFSSGLAVGFAIPTDKFQIKRGSDWLFTGNLSVYSPVNSWGGRVDVMYSQITQPASGEEIPDGERYVSIFGGSVGVTGRISPNPGHSLRVLAGAGLYETIRHDYNNQSMEGILLRETKPGYLFGAGWQHRLGGFDITFETRYLLLSGDLAPDTVQFIFGIALR